MSFPVLVLYRQKGFIIVLGLSSYLRENTVFLHYNEK